MAARRWSATSGGGGNSGSSRPATRAPSRQAYETRWRRGGLVLLGAFGDLMLDARANETAAEFVREKIRSIVHDPQVAELLSRYGPIAMLCGGHPVHIRTEQKDGFRVLPSAVARRRSTVKSAPVRTSALRLEVQMQKDWSAGVHEWKVK